MSNRYKVSGVWRDRQELAGYLVQSADITDQQNGQVYEDGAFRIVDAATEKPHKVGKGGTVPWYGEMAWASADRELNDLYWKDRRNN